MRPIFGFAAIVVAALTAMASRGQASEMMQMGNGKIVFMASVSVPAPEPASSQIRLMNPDGSDVTNLTPKLSAAEFPNWSADGARIAFSGEDGIYVMNAYGSDVRKVAGDASWKRVAPSWSPDGSRIAFWLPGVGSCGLYVMDADGNNQTLIMEDSGGGYDVGWSPDGARIAFSSSRDDDGVVPIDSEIYVMNADGSEQVRLTDSPGSDGEPDWSTDGSKIVFTSGREGSSSALYVMSTDGSDQRPLMRSQRCGLNPISKPGSSAASNSEFVCLGDEQPTWSPDGSMVAFVGFAGGLSDILVVNADGANGRRLTFTQDEFEWFPDWQPVPGALPPTAFSTAATPSPTPTPTSPDCIEPASRTVAPTLAFTETPTPPSSHPIFATPTPASSPPDSVLPTSFVTPSSAYFPTPQVTFSVTDSPFPFATPASSVPAPVATTPPVQCEVQDSAPIGTRQQAIAAGVVAAIVAGSLITLPAVALRRRMTRRSSKHCPMADA